MPNSFTNQSSIQQKNSIVAKSSGKKSNSSQKFKFNLKSLKNLFIPFLNKSKEPEEYFEFVKKLSFKDLDIKGLETMDMGRTRLKFFLEFYLSEDMYTFNKKVMEKEVRFLTINKDYDKVTRKYKKAYFANLELKVEDLDDKTLLPHARIKLSEVKGSTNMNFVAI
jgi:hypothetical protein